MKTQQIIPGASHHENYKAILRTIADLAKSTKGNDGNLVPLIFRPYHEFDGDWFWWEGLIAALMNSKHYGSLP